MRNRRQLHGAGLALGAVAGVALLVLLTRGVDLAQLLSDLRQANPGWLTASFVVACCALLATMCEWNLLLKRDQSCPLDRLYRALAIMCMLQNLAHHLIGQAYVIYRLAKKEKLGSPTAVSVIALDQTVEGVAKVLWLAVLLPCVALPEGAAVAVGGLAIAVALLYLALLVTIGIARRVAVQNMADRPGMVANALRWLAGFANTLDLLLHPQRMLLPFTCAIGKKLIRALAVLCVQHALGMELPWYVPLMVVAAIDLATLVPLAPGNVGMFEAAVSIAYRSQGVSAELALAAAVLFHMVWLAATILPGLIVFSGEWLLTLGNYPEPVEGSRDFENATSLGEFVAQPACEIG